MKSIHFTLVFILILSLLSCNNKLSEKERKEVEEFSGMRQNELGKYQQERIGVEQMIVTIEQRIKDLKAGKYNLSEEDLSVEIEHAELMLKDLKEKQKDVIRIIDQTRKELDSLDVLLQK